MGKYDIKPKEIGADTMAFTAHKFYGPKGIGALYIRNGVRIGKVITGGDQEKKLRPEDEDDERVKWVKKRNGVRRREERWRKRRRKRRRRRRRRGRKMRR